MSSEFDPSPRASKRRKTTRYGTQRTVLPEEDAPPQFETPEDVTLSGAVTLSHEAVQATPTKSQSSSRKSSIKRGSNGAANGGTGPVLRESHAELDTTESNGSPATPSRKAQRLRTCTGRGGKENAEHGDNIVHEKEGGRQNMGDSIPELEGSAQVPEYSENATPQPRSSGRQRRPPRRLAETSSKAEPKAKTTRSRLPITQSVSEAEESVPTSPALKGILTPSRKQGAGPRKSVVFNQDEKEIEEHFGFRDLNTPAPAKKLPRKSTPHPKKKSTNRELGDVLMFAADEGEDELQQNTENTYDNNTLDDQINLQVPVPIVLSELTPRRPSSRGEDVPALQTIKGQVLSRLTSLRLPSKAPVHLESQYIQLYSLLKATVASSESNSLLLLGPRGAGKSMLLNLALQGLSGNLHDYYTVRLNGFIQTDDRLALREIWRQLGHSRELEDEETEDIGASYADTMASLLSLLSHPDELFLPMENEDVHQLADDAVQMANGSRRTSKSIVFVLDEFDLFTTHPRQTLLYNLFDIAQSRKAPIAVVGCSSRMDVIEMLEKRVKSRFSHRWLLVPPTKTMPEFEACVQDALLIDTSDDVASRRSKEEERWVSLLNEHIKKSLFPSKEIKQLIKLYFYTTKSLPDLFTALYPIVAAIQLPALPTPDVSKTSTPRSSPFFQTQPSILTTLPSLPTLHLSLLIAMSRLEIIHHLATTNFNLIYTHYTELIQSSRLKQSAHGSLTHSGTLRQWSRETCCGAWEELGLWGMVVPVVGGARGGDDEGLGGEGEETRMWRCEVDLDDLVWGIKEKLVGEGGGGAGEVLGRWCREV